MVSLILYEQLAIIHIVASLCEMCHFSLTAFNSFSLFLVLKSNWKLLFFLWYHYYYLVGPLWDSPEGRSLELCSVLLCSVLLPSSHN